MTDIAKLGEELLGTCQSYDLDELTDKELEQLDDLVFLCYGCGWWVEPYGVDGEGNCEDCQGEEEHHG